MVPEPGSPGHDASGGVPPIVLFVDDDRDTLELYGGYFETNGLWVETAHDPGEALDVAVELRPNLIVTDLGFADRPVGIEFVCQVKADEELRRTPVIVVSGRPKEDLRESRRCGADVVLPKPCPPQDLLDQVRQLLSVSREPQQPSRTLPARVRREPDPIRIGSGQVEPVLRRCPSCHAWLEWVERGTLDGREYDYFRWCANGCGLYCFGRRSEGWLKLA